MEQIKCRIHSIVDLITNSSTVIFTYQNSIKQAKDLVNEVLRLSGSELNADDVFYYGVFCGSDRYGEYASDMDTDDQDDVAKEISGLDWEERDKYIDVLKERILRGEIEVPSWWSDAEYDETGDSWDPDSYLTLLPKDEKYSELANKIKALLNSVTADGGRDG